MSDQSTIDVIASILRPPSTLPQVNAATGRFSELASFIEDNWDRLSELESQEALGGTLVTALAQAGECAKAEEVLTARLEKLHPEDVPRFRLMISQCRGEEGPVMSLSFREMVEMMKDSAEDWRKKNELFRSGAVPIHWSAGMLNVPLTRLLIAIPRENQMQADARRRQPIPIISGARHRVRAAGVRKLALDITSVFVLGELGFLRRLIDTMETTMLSPWFMESLLLEEEKVRFHQPSRIEEAKPLLDLSRRGLLEVVSADGPSSLVEEVGVEMAALLMAAKGCGGVCVHSGKLYRAGSYMDAAAELGEFAGSLSSPSDIARMLYAEARVTLAVRDTALEYLDRVCYGGVAGASPAPGAPVFLERVTLWVSAILEATSFS